LPEALAVDSTWTNTLGGNWDDATSWKNGVPGPTTNAFLTNSLATSYAVTNDVLNNTFANLTIFDLNAGGTNTLLNNSNGFNPTGNVVLGARGIFDLNGFSALFGGSLTVSNTGAVIVRGATLTNTGNAILLGSLVITNNGTFQVGATGLGAVTNFGTITLGSGGTLAAGVITNANKITTVNGGGGSGVITGSVLNLLTPATVFGSGGINVAGGANDSSLSLLGAHPFLNDVNNGSILISTNGTLNVGGTTAATATGSFTNRAGITLFGGGATGFNTLNAGTIVNDTGVTISMNIAASSGGGGSGITNYLNADVINKGTIDAPGGSGAVLTRMIRSLVNSSGGTFKLGALASSFTIIQQGLTNDGTIVSGPTAQTLIVSNGFVNTANGAIGLFNPTIRAQYFVQNGFLYLTNNLGATAPHLFLLDGVTLLSFTNSGTISLYSQFLSNEGPTLTASNLLNVGTIVYDGNPGVANGIPLCMVIRYDGNLSNGVNGVINVRSNALAAFDQPIFNDGGTINIASNSVLAAGHTGKGGNAATPTTFSFSGGANDWTNNGTINMATGSFLAVKSLANLSSGIISGAGQIGPVLFRTITNTANTATQYVQNVTVANVLNSGRIAPSGTLNVGAITNLSGGSIIGNGVIQSINITNFWDGTSFVSSNIYPGSKIVNNAGATIMASGGTLVLSNGLAANSNAGTIGATNGGLLQLGDGTGAFPLTNNGTLLLAGGGFKSGDLWNTNRVLLTGDIDNLTVAGTFTMTNGSTMLISNATATVAGVLASRGAIQVVNSTVTFSNLVSLSGSYISDPSTNIFTTNLTVTASGFLQGGNGDLFQFERDFVVQSTNNLSFNLVNSTVLFTNDPAQHLFNLTGSTATDNGTNYSGIAAVTNNFAIGNLILSASDSLRLTGSVANALYVGALDFGGLANTNNLTLDVNLYYDSTLAANSYLNSDTYDLAGAGMLIPYPGSTPVVPEPSALSLLALAATLGGVLRRRWESRRGA
jgi:hypothetical protein